MKTLLLKAAKANLTSQREAALATLEVYLSNSVGVGDHPNLVEEVTQQIKALAEAEEGLTTLENHFDVD